MTTNRNTEPRELSQQSFARLAKLITGELGIKMPPAKLTMVQSRLMRRVRELRLESVEEYAEYLLASPPENEREQFINAITTNKTEFFREPAHFEFLRRVVLPELSQAARYPAPVRVWSAGCSSGEEVYTLAMVLSDYGLTRPDFDFSILGTDVSTCVLETASRAIYEESLIAPVPPDMRRRYIWRNRSPEEPTVRIVPQLRGRVSFRRLNLMHDDYGLREMFQVAFFRNVMIYFDRPTQEAVTQKICRRLAPGAYLFVGHSESLAGFDLPLRVVETSVFRKTL